MKYLVKKKRSSGNVGTSEFEDIATSGWGIRMMRIERRLKLPL